MDSANTGWPDSLWAAMTRPGPNCRSSSGLRTPMSSVIGAGFTGLSTALHLREAAWMLPLSRRWSRAGCIGRNNGQVIPTLSRPTRKTSSPNMARSANGSSRCCATAHRHCSMSRGAIKFRPSRNSRAGCSRCTRRRIKIAERRVRQWSKFGAPVELLSREQTRAMLGSDAWFGGFWNRSGGHINPLALSRGLARVVVERGGRIYARSPAISF